LKWKDEIGIFKFLTLRIMWREGEKSKDKVREIIIKLKNNKSPGEEMSVQNLSSKNKKCYGPNFMH